MLWSINYETIAFERSKNLQLGISLSAQSRLSLIQKKWDGTRKNNFSILLTLKEEKKTFTQSLNYSSIEMEDEFNFGSLNYYTSYFVHWKVFCDVFFHLVKRVTKKRNSTFWVQNLSTEQNFFKWEGKVTKIWHLLFERIWK